VDGKLLIGIEDGADQPSQGQMMANTVGNRRSVDQGGQGLECHDMGAVGLPVQKHRARIGPAQGGWSAHRIGAACRHPR
jgi:hypothetical protein